MKLYYYDLICYFGTLPASTVGFHNNNNNNNGEDAGSLDSKTNGPGPLELFVSPPNYHIHRTTNFKDPPYCTRVMLSKMLLSGPNVQTCPKSGY